MQIIMPKLGLTMTEGTLTRWRKAEGDPVEPGEILFEFESEKSALEFESPTAGILSEILVAAGQTVPCGTPVCVVGARSQPVTVISAAPALQKPAVPPLSTPLSVENQAHRLPATPRAKARAHELHVDLRQLQGSGPDGRIQLTDVERWWAGQTKETSAPKLTPVARRMAAEQQLDPAAVAAGANSGRITKEDVVRASQTVSPALPGELIPLSATRQVIAERLSQSAFTAPHVTLFTEAEATYLVEARTQLNAELPPEQKIGYNTLLAAICAKTLREQPQFNAVFDQAAKGIRLQPEINIALAVDTERGLTTPVLARVDTLSLTAIQQGYAVLIERATSGQLRPDDLAGGTFTLTNLGAFEVDGFTPIINPPQLAILGVGRIVAKPVVHQNEVVIRQMMALSLSFDHRAIDGAPAARFLQRIKQLVERPFALMV
ncbi:MAG: 2-oxo acid dehydrogenase subunit E2 [Anaerolineales bacterium]|nr:2-oxo acid dehydrogenase subunit E2 [Anaerolineales bacterium]